MKLESRKPSAPSPQRSNRTAGVPACLLFYRLLGQGAGVWFGFASLWEWLRLSVTADSLVVMRSVPTRGSVGSAWFCGPPSQGTRRYCVSVLTSSSRISLDCRKKWDWRWPRAERHSHSSQQKAEPYKRSSFCPRDWSNKASRRGRLRS